MSELLQRLKKSSKIDRTDILSKSDFFKVIDPVPTAVPALNIALGASLKGGVTPGLIIWAGPSKHFKTSYQLLYLKAYLDKYPEAIGMWYDSEFGSPQAYFESFGIDPNRVLHIPITNIEELKFDLVNQLNEIKRGDKVMICVDSVGNLASKKEVEDAMNEKAVADMTRAKQLKSLFRMITPVLTMKDLPMSVVNHTYMTQEMYSKTIVSGGCVIKGTLIQTPEGLKPVEEFRVGDKVITMSGQHTVTNVWDPETLLEGEPECYEIEFEDGFVVTCSEEHKFLVEGKWVEAKNLKENDDVLVNTVG
jgi:preprotein translocase subunit YajC